MNRGVPIIAGDDLHFGRTGKVPVAGFEKKVASLLRYEGSPALPSCHGVHGPSRQRQSAVSLMITGRGIRRRRAAHVYLPAEDVCGTSTAAPSPPPRPEPPLDSSGDSLHSGTLGHGVLKLSSAQPAPVPAQSTA